MDLMDLVRDRPGAERRKPAGLSWFSVSPGDLVAAEGRSGCWSVLNRGQDTALIEHIGTGERERVPLCKLSPA